MSSPSVLSSDQEWDDAGLALLELEVNNEPGGTAQPAPSRESAPTVLTLVEWLLKNPASVDRLNRQPRWQGELFPRFLLIALTSYLIYAWFMVLTLNLSPAAAYPHTPWLRLPPASWSDGTAWSLPLAYAVGIVLAACVCLPSFYFYSLLAGVRLSWLQIISVIGKGMAANAILLLGLAPIYMILALGTIILALPLDTVRLTLGVGLALPFLAGLWGMRAIYLGIMDLTTTLPPEWQCRRYCFLRRLIVAWSGVYTAVVPIMIYRLWETFALGTAW